MNYEEALSFLFNLKPKPMTYGIDRMRWLIQKLQNPHRKFPSIHVAGTNGKGSVCAMLEAIYRHSGYKTALFTSPHLVDLRERIQINRNLIDTSSFLKYFHQILSLINPSLPEISFFEFINAIAFLYFADQQVDIALVEVGLGGELDSTNILTPEISVITTIGFDHTEILGNSLQAITHAKAGIIKKNKPIVIGNLPQIARKIIEQKASASQSKLHTIPLDPQSYPQTNLFGPHQKHNAMIAKTTCEVLHPLFPVQSILSPLMQVHWPGRWQTISLKNGNTLILEAAHNNHASQELQISIQHFKDIHNTPLTIILGTTGDFGFEDILPVISIHTQKLILTQPNSPKATSLHQLKNALPPDYKG